MRKEWELGVVCSILENSESVSLRSGETNPHPFENTVLNYSHVGFESSGFLSVFLGNSRKYKIKRLV